MIDSMAGADKSWMLASICLPLVAALAGCSVPARATGPAHSVSLLKIGHNVALVQTPPPPPPPLSPFADSAVSFFIHGHFALGEQVVVRVCLHADHSIASSDILESSGDRRFDERALDWARRVQLRTQAAPGRAIARCGFVRVELNDTAAPGMGRAAGEQLG